MTKVTINRAPVLTLWGVVVAEALGYPRATALTLGKSVAGKGAFAKAKRIGIAEERAPPEKKRSPIEPKFIVLMGAEIPVLETKDGVRAIAEGKPTDPKAVEKYLAQKFGEHLGAVEEAMRKLAASRGQAALAREAFGLYEKFRPAVAPGAAGWGKPGILDTAVYREAGVRDAQPANMLLRFWNDVTAQSPVELVSPLARDEVVRRLTAAIDTGWSYFGSKPVVGAVGKDTFRLRWRINYRNSFQTVLFGTFVDHGRGTRLKCRTGMHPIVAVFMGFWLGVVGVLAGVSLSIPGDGMTVEYVIPLIMFAFGIVLVSVGRWIARNERDHLIGFLKRTVDARAA